MSFVNYFNFLKNIVRQARTSQTLETLLWKVQYQCVRICVFLCDFLCNTSLKSVPSRFCTFDFSVCSRGLQGWSVMLPCGAVCDLNHYFQGDMTCQKPITPFMLFIPAGSMTCCTKYMFIPFHFLFLPWKIQDTNNEQRAPSKGWNVLYLTHTQTLLCMNTARPCESLWKRELSWSDSISHAPVYMCQKLWMW